MKTISYLEYEKIHPEFKAICNEILNNYFINIGDCWFKDKNNEKYSPFSTGQEELDTWKKYNLNKTSTLRNYIFTKYFWLALRLFFFFYYNNKKMSNVELDSNFQELLLMLNSCIEKFDINSDNNFYTYYTTSFKYRIITLHKEKLQSYACHISRGMVSEIQALYASDDNILIKDNPHAIKICNIFGFKGKENETLKYLKKLIMFYIYPSISIYYRINFEDSDDVFIADVIEDHRQNLYKTGEFLNINDRMTVLKKFLYKTIKRKSRYNEVFKKQLDMFFMYIGFIKTDNGNLKYDNVDTTETYIASMYNTTRQTVSNNIKIIKKNIEKLNLTKDNVLDILNSTEDENYFIKKLNKTVYRS